MLEKVRHNLTLSPSSLRGSEVLELMKTAFTSADYKPVRLKRSP